MIDIPTYFERYAWVCESLESGVWRSTFATESEEDFDIYVMVAEDWIHFAVSPFVAAVPQDSAAHVYAVLLRLNQELRFARFALDGDGDINLLADLPIAHCTYEQFALVLDALVYYADRLAGEVRKTAANPAYQSPLFG